MKIKIGILMILAAISIVGCKKTKSKDIVTKEQITLGAILPLTGPASIYGNYVKEGQEKALKYINDSLLKDKNQFLKIVYEDSKASPKDAILAYNKLRNNNITLFNSTLSSVCLSLLPKVAQDSVLFFADAAHPNLIDLANPYVFRHSNTSEQEVELILNYIRDSTETKNIALCVVNDDYGVSFKEIFEKTTFNKQLNSTFVELFDKSQTNFKVLAQKLKELKNTTIVVVGYGQPLGLLIKEIRLSRNQSEIIAGIGYIITDAQKTAGETSKGLKYVNFDFEGNTEAGIKGFETLGYGTTLLIGNAVSKGHTTPKQIATYIKELKEFKTQSEYMKIKDNNITPSLRIDTY